MAATAFCKTSLFLRGGGRAVCAGGTQTGVPGSDRRGVRSQPVANVKWPGRGKRPGASPRQRRCLSRRRRRGTPLVRTFSAFWFHERTIRPSCKCRTSCCHRPVRLTRPRGLPGLPTCPGAADWLPWALSRSFPAGQLPTPPTRGVREAPAGLNAPPPLRLRATARGHGSRDFCGEPSCNFFVAVRGI